MTVEGPTAGETLYYERGWRQGCVIPAQLAQFVHRSLDGTDVDSVAHATPFLVLVTQDCDLVRSSDRYPYVEAIACHQDIGLARTVMPNNTQYFVLDGETGLVADRSHQVLVSKEALLSLPPPAEPCGGDSLRRRRFAVWLGARYDRPAIPEGAVGALLRPLSAAIQKLCRTGRRHEQLNREVSEVRAVGDLEQGPPFVVALIFILTPDADAEGCRLGIAEVIAEAGFLVEGVDEPDDASEASVHVRTWYAVPPSELPLDVYVGSLFLPLEYESVRGEEGEAAMPLDAESA